MDGQSLLAGAATELVGRVECGWIEALFNTKGGDAEAFATAAEALEASTTWPVAVAVEAGGFPPVIAQIIDSLDPDGDGLSDQYNRQFPISWEEVTSTLGCDDSEPSPTPVPPATTAAATTMSDTTRPRTR